MPLTPLAFTGISQFSADFQSILTRAVNIASVPLKRLQNDESDLLQKKTLLGSLSSGIESLGSSVKNLGTVAAAKAIAASSSDTSKVAITGTTANAPATYTISDITSVASAASETSASGYADSTAAAVSTTGVVKLTVGSQEYTINLTPQTNNLIGLRDAINNLGAGVTASVITTGTGPTPNYLSVTATATGATTLTLKDDPTGANTDLLTSANQGSNAVFKVNGAQVSRASNSVTDVIDGVSFSILGTTSGAETVTVSLATNRSKLSTAIQDFVNNFNSTLDQVGNQVGPAAGLLTGDFIVRDIQASLRNLTSYSGTASIKNIFDLGVSADSTGKLAFDSTVFNALSDTQVSDGFDFFGSATTGFGGLSAKFTQLSEPVTGLIKIQIDGYDLGDKRIQKQITDLTDRINDLQGTISSRLQAADAVLAQLESQQRLVDASIKGLSLALFGRNDN